jgi:hypothetical protein
LYLLIYVETLWTGKTSSRGHNVTNSERLSNIKYQEKDPRSAFYKGSAIPQQYKGSAIGSPSFGYQEKEQGLHMPQSKRSLTGNFCFLNV